MEHQSLLHKKLLESIFVYTAESTPPDASNQEVLLKKVSPLKGIADAVILYQSEPTQNGAIYRALAINSLD